MGQTDIPLNETGIAQAKVAAQNLKHIKFSSIAVSPLARAKITAEIISESNPTPISIIHDLKECGWGIREGHPKGDGSGIGGKTNLLTKPSYFLTFPNVFSLALHKP